MSRILVEPAQQRTPVARLATPAPSDILLPTTKSGYPATVVVRDGNHIPDPTGKCRVLNALVPALIAPRTGARLRRPTGHEPSKAGCMAALSVDDGLC